MMTLDKFEEAYEIVQKVILKTKLVFSDYYSDITGNKVYFKPENMQKTGRIKSEGHTIRSAHFQRKIEAKVL